MAHFAERFQILREEGQDCLVELYQHLLAIEGSEVVRTEQDPALRGTQHQKQATISGTSQASETAGPVRRASRTNSWFAGSVAHEGGLSWLQELKTLKKVIVSKYPHLDVVEQERDFSRISEDFFGTFTSLDGLIKCLQKVWRFREAVKEDLNGFLMRVNVLETSTNYPITFLFLDTLTVFFKVIHMLGRLNESGNLFMATALYASAHSRVQNQVFNGFKRLSDLLQHVYYGATVAVQSDLPENSSDFIFDIVKCLRREMRICENFLDDGNDFAFDLIAQANSSGWTNTSGSSTDPTQGSLFKVQNGNVFRNLTYFSKFQEWSSVALLLSTSKIQQPQYREMFVDYLRVFLKDGFWLHLCRGLRIFLHNEWREWLNALNDSKSPVYDPNFLSRLQEDSREKRDTVTKEFIKELEQDAVKSSPLKHKRRMRMLLGAARRSLCLVQECPGILGPQFGRIFSLVSCIRGEIEWYFLHLIPPPKKSSVARNLYQEEAFQNPDIVEVIGVAASLSEMLRSNKEIVQRYSAKYLGGALYRRFQRAVSKVEGLSYISPNLRETFESLRDTLADVGSSLQEGKSFEEINLFKARTNWLRCISSIWCSDAMKLLKDSGGTDTQEANPLRELIDCGNRTFEIHSWRLDAFDYLMADFACLQQLWWYRNSIFKNFQEALTQREKGVPHHIGDVFRMLNHAPLNCRSSNPKELQEFREAAASLAKNSWIPTFRAAVRHHLTELVTWSAYYNVKVDLELSLERFVLLESAAQGFTLPVDTVHDKKLETFGHVLDKKTKRQIKELGATPGTEVCLSDSIGNDSDISISDEEGIRVLRWSQRSLEILIHDTQHMEDLLIGNTFINLIEVARKELTKAYQEAIQDLQSSSVQSLFKQRIPSSTNSKFFSNMYRPRYIAKGLEAFTDVMLDTVGYGTELSDCIRETYCAELAGSIGQEYIIDQSGSKGHRGTNKGSNALSESVRELDIVSLVSRSPQTTATELHSSFVGSSLASAVAEQLREFVEEVVGVPGSSKKSAETARASASVLYSEPRKTYAASPFNFSTRHLFDMDASLILTKHETSELGELLGIRGFRIVSSVLLGLVSEYLKELYDFLSAEFEWLHKLVEASSSERMLEITGTIPGNRLARAFGVAVSIGHALNIREMLARAVSEALQRHDTSCRQTVQGARAKLIAAELCALNTTLDKDVVQWLQTQAVSTVDSSSSVARSCSEGPYQGYNSLDQQHLKSNVAHGDTSGSGAFAEFQEVTDLINDLSASTSGSISSFLGHNGVPDPSLNFVVKECVDSSRDPKFWGLLPIGIAAIFGADVWKKAHFSNGLEAFSNNAQMVAITGHRLVHAVYYSLPTSITTEAAGWGIGRTNQRSHTAWMETMLERSTAMLTALMDKHPKQIPLRGFPFLIRDLGTYGDLMAKSTFERKAPCAAGVLNSGSAHSMFYDASRSKFVAIKR
eukprot:gb/GECG01014674.1/.p1 GENE.gb/GECG01014674.1/~~gb/GECG01014674.1/.p1  ORF type:complete len:1451 (+),score=183.62 gb/GECG01014674.1/:1-4353(+)